MPAPKQYQDKAPLPQQYADVKPPMPPQYENDAPTMPDAPKPHELHREDILELMAKLRSGDSANSEYTAFLQACKQLGLTPEEARALKTR